MGADLFQYGGKTYLSVYDAYSNYLEVEELPNDATSGTMVQHMSSIFARHGLPLEVCTNNGPQFAASEFRKFARDYDFAHTTLSPQFPKSNGLAEKGVQIAKRILKKSLEANVNFHLGLLTYRSSPLENGMAPSQWLMGRLLRTRLPDIHPTSGPSVTKHKQDSTRGSVQRPLQDGEDVRLRTGNTWSTKAKVLTKVAPRSYLLQTEHDQILRRNRQHILSTDPPLGQKGSVTVQPSATGWITGPRPHDAVITEGQARRRKPPRRLCYDEQFRQLA